MMLARFQFYKQNNYSNVRSLQLDTIIELWLFVTYHAFSLSWYAYFVHDVYLTLYAQTQWYIESMPTRWCSVVHVQGYTMVLNNLCFKISHYLCYIDVIIIFVRVWYNTAIACSKGADYYLYSTQASFTVKLCVCVCCDCQKCINFCPKLVPKT